MTSTKSEGCTILSPTNLPVSTYFALLHCASRPWNEAAAWTIHFQQPRLNLFITGDNAAGTVYLHGHVGPTIVVVLAGLVAWAGFAFWAHAAWIGVRPFG